MRLGFTYDLKDDYRRRGFDEESVAEFDSALTVDAIASTLTRLGYEVDRIGGLEALVRRLARGERWEAVFNIAECMLGRIREAAVPALLEEYGIPVVFSDALTLALAHHKPTGKRLLHERGIRTAAFRVVRCIEDAAAVDLPLPLFAKPVSEGSSKGIHLDSLVTSPEQLVAVCERLLTTHQQSVLVEQFLPGREFTVCVIGSAAAAEVLGVTEIVVDPEASHSYSLEVKSADDYHSIVQYRLCREPELAAECRKLALDAWRALRGRDAGRVDIRLDAEERPNVLEINPIPGLRRTDSDFTITTSLLGISYEELLARIMASLHTRLDLPAPRRPRPRTRARGRRLAGEPVTQGRCAVWFADPAKMTENDELEALVQSETLMTSLQALGWEVVLASAPSRSLDESVRRLLDSRPDVVFNMLEETDGVFALNNLPAYALETLGLPYTGCSGDAIALTTDKTATKAVLRAAGLPTPDWITTAYSAIESDHDAGFLIKPARADASTEIDENRLRLVDGSDRAREMLSTLPPAAHGWFAEAYVHAREFNISVLEIDGRPQVLPLAEMLFLDYPPEKPRIVGRQAKWNPSSFEYGHMERAFSVDDEDPALAARLRQLTLGCWQLFELAGYARVDFRVDADAHPWILEVNCNPSIAPDAGFVAAAARAGMSYADVAGAIVEAACRRRTHAVRR
ncbi:MAG: hypothetical protein OES32_08820 [Acidobacteriota bacterium]|nr:hypothetical protein [Acidobacteriota bacterium]